MDAQMVTVAQFLGDEFIDLLGELPDAFFRLSQAEKERIWTEIYSACVHGEKNVTKLAMLACAVPT